MQLFILRAVKPKKEDIFGLFPNDEYVYFFCKGLKDLRQTIRHITPKGYRVPSSQWFSKYLKMNNYDLILQSGFLVQHEAYRIIKLEEEPKEYKIFEYENRDQKIYPLKAVVSETHVNNIKALFPK